MTSSASTDPLKVKGYTPLTTDKVSLVNQNKVIEELALRQCDSLARDRDSKEIDQRWLAVAKSHFQEGFMALNRAVFQPERILGELSIERLMLLVSAPALEKSPAPPEIGTSAFEEAVMDDIMAQINRKNGL